MYYDVYILCEKKETILKGGETIPSHTVCCVCGKEHSEDILKHVEIKGNEKKICPECVAAIKGFV